MKIINIRKQPKYKEKAIAYFQKRWANDNTKIIYEDCISHSLTAENPLPIWYLLMDGEQIVGGAALVTNDFISRMDLYPWFVALFIEENYRGNNLGRLLIEKAKSDSAEIGFKYMYLSTKHIGYYEKFGFEFIGMGYHPWGDSSRIYKIAV